MMKIHACILVLSASIKVIAQTPSNFSVVSTLPLDIYLNPSNATLLPGQLVSEDDVLQAPTVSVVNSANLLYVAFMVDPTSDSGSYLHWLQPNLSLSTNGTLVASDAATSSSNAVGASYMNPTPPNDGYAHEYVLLLYLQPPDWQIPNSYADINPPETTRVRIGFDMASFQQTAGLSDPIGANFFRVLDGSAEMTTSLSAIPTDGGQPATASNIPASARSAAPGVSSSATPSLAKASLSFISSCYLGMVGCVIAALIFSLV